MVSVPAARPVFVPDDRAQILALIDEALKSGSLTLGDNTRSFEESFRLRHGASHAVAVSSGTAALEIILRALGVAGREVIVPTNTFFATAAAAIHAGGVVRFADVDPTTLCLSTATIEPLLNDRTAAVVLVHIGGAVSPDTPAIADLCRRAGVPLVEDAAHAHGSTLDGRAAGTFGAAGAFSFYATKVMTSGEGGMIITNDPTLYEDALIYRDQGKASFVGGDHVRMGYAWRMSELHAAVGRIQFRRLDEFITTRQRVAALYDEALDAIDGITPVMVPPGSNSNYYKYIAMLDAGLDRAAVKTELRERFDVALSGEVYSSPLHRQPVFSHLADGPLPVADDVCSRHVCLPVHSDMRDAEVEQVLLGLGQLLGQRAEGRAIR